MGPIESYGPGLPGLDPAELTGKLIVLEGTDGVGRSTHISLLKIWLQMNGRAVVDTEAAQSALTGEGLKEAKQGHTLGPIAMTLFYATDLADNLEQLVIPALRAGFVVLTDRYIFTLMARAMVRDMQKEWLQRMFSFALKPDAVLYLKADVKDLIPRVLHSTGFDYWESGMDLKLGETYYESFCEYQKRLITTLDSMGKEFNFTEIDASKDVEEVFGQIKEALSPIVGIPIETADANEPPMKAAARAASKTEENGAKDEPEKKEEAKK
jgi:dTMP kinase